MVYSTPQCCSGTDASVLGQAKGESEEIGRNYCGTTDVIPRPKRSMANFWGGGGIGVSSALRIMNDSALVASA